MIRTQLLHVLLLLFVAIVSYSVRAPSPPKLVPEWLEDFLKMDWEEGSKIELETHHQGGNPHESTSHSAAGMSIPAQNVAAPHQGALIHQPLPPFRQDGLEPSISSALGDPATAQPGALHREQLARLTNVPSFNTHPANSHTFATPDIGRAFSAPFVPASESLLPASSSRTSPGVSGQGEVHMHSPAIPLQLSVAAADPWEAYIFRLSDNCVYEPSDELMDEMFQFLSPSRPNLPDGAHRIPKEEIRLRFQQNTKHYFRAGYKVYTVQLPSHLVFIRFFPTGKLVRQATFPQIMTIWSVETKEGSPLLTLRGAWSVATWVQPSVVQAPSVVPCAIKTEIFSDRMSGYAVVRTE
ncbi:uncharacterized protein UTRI_01127_B [Ustilago trichophora]|uniref:Effector family protein Eff1 n=1 Tax=Ustilago trichophora TaxID=86804 RepID=A0A5C3DTS6_9BASI|nr:uncharacterized protein UTRI_01127_B [Ustilago trichophora]